MVKHAVAGPAPRAFEIRPLIMEKPAYRNAEPIENTTPSKVLFVSKSVVVLPCCTIIKNVPMIAPERTSNSCKSATSCPRATPIIVMMTGGRQSAISVGTAAPICSIPKNQSKTYPAIAMPAKSTVLSNGFNRSHKMLRPKTTTRTTAPMTNRQKETFSGEKPCWATSIFTIRAPVPHITPALQADAKANFEEEG